MVTILINISALLAFSISLYYSREKSRQAVKTMFAKTLELAPLMLLIISGIGLIFSWLPPSLIRQYLGGEFKLIQVLASAGFGAIMMIPSLIALPLAGSLVEAGASYTTIAAFITTLTMVGFVTLPIELKELGPKVTILRNVLALLFAVFISFLIGVMM